MAKQKDPTRSVTDIVAFQPAGASTSAVTVFLPTQEWWGSSSMKPATCSRPEL